MAERQAISTISDPSPPAATSNLSQKAASKTQSASARPRIVHLDLSSSPDVSAPPVDENPVWASISSPTAASSSSSRILATGVRKPVPPAELFSSPSTEVPEEQDPVPSPLIRRPKPYSITATDRKGKGKAKAEGGFTLDQLEASIYLGDVYDFPIQPPPLPVQVSRKALTEEYGLPGIGFLWKSKNKNRPLKFMIPTIGLNPEMPRSPGEPGLLLSCREEMLKDGPWTLFIRADGSKKVRLNYAGEYTCKKVGTMAKEEFAAQDQSASINYISELLFSVAHMFMFTG